MACYTMVQVELDDTAILRKARKNLGLAETGNLSQYDAQRVTKEAATLRTMQAMRRLDPSAVIRRKGDKLTISVNR